MKSTILKLTTIIACLFMLTLNSCKKDEESNDPNIVDKVINQTLSNNFDFLAQDDANTVYLDVDGDGTNDIIFEAFYEKTDEEFPYDSIINGIGFFANVKDFGAGQVDGGHVLTTGSSLLNYLPALKKLNSGDKINASSTTWADGGFVYAKYFTNSSNINSVESGSAGTDQIIPFRFKITNTNMHYGWVKVNLSADRKVLTIKEVAYHKTPNTEIIAGAK